VKTEIVTALETRTAQTERLAAYFAARPHQVLTHAELVREVGENFRSRLTALKRRGMEIENVPVFTAEGKRGYGSYVHRPNAQGRDAGTFIHGQVEMRF
jgi:uncharacterized protein (DUF885 family)